MLALAERLVAALGAAALARGEPAAMVAGALALLATLALAMLGLAGPALGIAAAGSFAFAVGARFARLKTALLQAPHSHTLAWLRDPGSDALVSVALALALAPPDGLAPIAALGPLAIGAARLAAASPKAAAAAFWRDRTVQLALIALAASFGLLGQATALMALSALAQVLFTKRDQPIPQ